MVEVTNEMLALLREYQMGAYGELDDDCDKRMIAALIELYEQGKPKPEPVAWAICRFERIFESKEFAEKYREVRNIHGEPITPLYTTPPTREPLSDDDIWRIWDDGDNVSSALDFARAIEQAHGIGVTK